jgi:hypothetical protein
VDETYYYEPVYTAYAPREPISHHIASKLRLDTDQFYYEFLYVNNGVYWSVAVVADSQQEAEDYLSTDVYPEGSKIPQLIFQRIAKFDDIAVKKS